MPIGNPLQGRLSVGVGRWISHNFRNGGSLFLRGNDSLGMGKCGDEGRQQGVYTIFSLPKPLYTALIASAKDNIPTNSLILNSHSTNSFINRCLFKFRWLLDFTFSLFHVLLVLLCLMFSFYFFYSFIVTVYVCHTALKGYLLTYLLNMGWVLPVQLAGVRRHWSRPYLFNFSFIFGQDKPDGIGLNNTSELWWTGLLLFLTIKNMPT